MHLDGSCSAAITAIAESTAAAPDMSVFMSSIESLGLRLRPPESKVTPLPTSTMRLRGLAGLWLRWMNFGSSTLPWETARNMPMFILRHSSRP